MAEAYASLVSVMNTIDLIIEHGRNSFALNHEQIESVHEKAAFLVEFLECYSHVENKEVKCLESQIADAAHVAEDQIESKVVDYIRENQSTSFDLTRYNPLCLRLQDVIEAMDLVKNKAVKMKGKGELKVQLPKGSTPSSCSRSLPAGKDIMVGFDDVLIQIVDRLTRQQSNRIIIPIFGMGGIGKTTLTRNIYKNSSIIQHFDIRAWVTVSQQYDIKEILSSLLLDFKALTEEKTQDMNVSQLGEKLHKHLFGRRYLIVMDDMWSIDVWDKVQLFFPENGNGSRILITTRLTNMASHLGSYGCEMNFLDNDQSWNLLRKKVFGQQECTSELEDIGKKIAKNCKGLPLSIVVIAGLLAKSNMTPEYWYNVAEKVSSIVTQADDGQCSKILSLSYVNLSIHLKPCFLYMGVFPEDNEIPVSRLIGLWVAEGFLKPNRAKSLEEVAEGFLKPNRAKSLEEVAEEYLMDLIDRNLIMVHKLGIQGNVKFCKIHDLLRDLCIREAQKEKFICVAKSLDSSQTLLNQRRIVTGKIGKERKDPMSPLRSITYYTDLDKSIFGGRLIRVLNGRSENVNVVNLINLRYLYFRISMDNFGFKFPSTISLLWNIQTLIIRGLVKEPPTAPPEIWEMKQLRHLYSDFIYLPEPPPSIDSNIKHHLQTLKRIVNLTLSERMVKRIPNIKKLQLYLTVLDKEKDYCLDNLQHLHKLESLCITFISYKTTLQGNILFPHSLKELKLYRTYMAWEDLTIIGCLPNLEVLKLRKCGFIGEEWNPIEGEFISLKYLEIRFCNDLKVWNAESIHFPVLEQLILHHIKGLTEIPLGIGEIPTLQRIQLYYCCDLVVRSAIDIVDEQELQGNNEIQVQVWLDSHETQLQNLEARDNLKFSFFLDSL